MTTTPARDDGHGLSCDDLRAELKERKATLGALVEHWRGLALDRAATIARLRTEAAEVRAAAFDQAADAVRSGAIQFDSEAAAHALTNGGGIALIAYVQTTIADALSHRAAAARPDNTTGA